MSAIRCLTRQDGRGTCKIRSSSVRKNKEANRVNIRRQPVNALEEHYEDAMWFNRKNWDDFCEEEQLQGTETEVCCSAQAREYL